MNIPLGYADLIRLFNGADPTEFDPGLVPRENGIFVASPDELQALARGEIEEAELTRHPTGNLSEPVLPIPFNLKQLEKFIDFYGKRGEIDAFQMAEVLETKAWELARVEAKEVGQYHWPIVAGLYTLREKIEAAHAAENNDGKKVVLREVLDELNAVLPDHDKPPRFDGWPWGEYENKNLRLLASAIGQFWEPADEAKPDDAPENGSVVSWLRQQGATDGVARKIASIIRADWAPEGRRRKKE